MAKSDLRVCFVCGDRRDMAGMKKIRNRYACNTFFRNCVSIYTEAKDRQVDVHYWYENRNDVLHEERRAQKQAQKQARELKLEEARQARQAKSNCIKPAHPAIKAREAIGNQSSGKEEKQEGSKVLAVFKFVWFMFKFVFVLGVSAAAIEGSPDLSNEDFFFVFVSIVVTWWVVKYLFGLGFKKTT